MTVALLALPRVLEALRLILLGDAILTGQLATAPAALGGGPAIYTDGVVPAGATPPYLTLGPFTERSESTLGGARRWGSVLTTQIKLVTTSPDIGASLATIDRIVALLHDVPLTVRDYSHGSCALQVLVDAFDEKVAGIVWRHYPTLWEVHVGQPT